MRPVKNTGTKTPANKMGTKTPASYIFPVPQYRFFLDSDRDIFVHTALLKKNAENQVIVKKKDPPPLSIRCTVGDSRRPGSIGTAVIAIFASTYPQVLVNLPNMVSICL